MIVSVNFVGYVFSYSTLSLYCYDKNCFIMYKKITPAPKKPQQFMML